MRNVVWCSIAVAALVFPTLAVAENHVWTREGGDLSFETPAAATSSSRSHFALSPSKLNLCSASDSARYQVRVTPAEGVDLVADSDDLDLGSLLGAAAIKANAVLLGESAGVDLADPQAVRRLGGSSRSAADVLVRSDLADLRLQLFRGSEACAGAAGAGDGLRRVTAASDSCSGWCSCSTCACAGSLSCCESGCMLCWEYLEDQVGCGAT